MNRADIKLYLKTNKKSRTKITEKTVRKNVLKYLKDKGITVWPYPGVIHGARGFPDLFGCHRGRFFAIELKAPGRKATPLQEKRLDEIRDTGGLAIIASCVADVEVLYLEMESPNHHNM